MGRLLFFIFMLIAVPSVQALSYSLKIPEKKLQEKVTAMMPIEKKKFLIKVTLFNPKVRLLNDNDKISIYSQVDVLAPGKISVSGEAKISGDLSYDSKKGAFFLKNPKIESLMINKLPKIYSSKVKKISQIIIDKLLSTYPVYKLKDSNVKQKLAKSVLKSISIKNKILTAKLSLF